MSSVIEMVCKQVDLRWPERGLYDLICELSLDCTPPPKVVEVFERIDSEGCKILAEFGSLIRKI